MDEKEYEEKPHTRVAVSNRAWGGSMVVVECPFCGDWTKAYVWSMAGVGKKCECGALHLWHGSMSRREVPDVDVQTVGDRGGVHGYIAKGHITSEELEAAIRDSWDTEFEVAGLYVAHETMRCVPTPYTDEYDFMYVDSEPGPGAFECTTVYL